jgi:integrase
MASIRKRGEYQWQAEVRRKGWPYQSRIFETRVEAERWARDIEGEMDKGVFISRAEAESTTLKECLDRYLKEVTPLKKSASKEKSVINKLMRHDLASRFMATIRGADIAEYRDSRLKDSAPKTVLNEMALISHIFNTAIREWRMESLRNPVELVSKPKVKNGRNRRASHEEIEAILSCTKSRELPAIVRLLTETAMRRGELAKLTWANIDKKKRLALLEDTKNGEDRIVPLSSKAMQALESVPRRISGKVFGSMTPDAITRAFNRAVTRARERYEGQCKESGIEPVKGYLEDLRVHDLRHEATSRLFESGKFDMMEVASITGHKTLQMLKRYTHLRAEELAKKLG